MMASSSITSRIGDKDYQDIINTIKRMIEAKRCACTLEQVLKDYRQLRHKKVAFDVYGYSSERDLLEKSKLFKFRVKDGKIYIELKTVKKKKSKSLKSTSKLSNFKKIDYHSSESSSRSTSRSESLIQSNVYTSVKDLKLNEQTSKTIELQNITEKEGELLHKLKLKDDSLKPKFKQPETERTDNEKLKNERKNKAIVKYKETDRIANDATKLKINKNVLASKSDAEQKLTKVQLAMQNMLRNRAGKDQKPKTLTINAESNVKPFVARTAKEAFRHQLLEERQEMEKQIQDIQRRKLAGQEFKEHRGLEKSTKATVNAMESVKEEPVYVSEYSGARATPLTKLNISGTSGLNVGSSSPSTTNPQKTAMELNFLELHVVNILHTKVSAHPNGFIAEDMPAWYQGTFEKTLPSNWMDLVKRSKRFYIEKLEDKSLLYAMDKYNAMMSEMELKDNPNESNESNLIVLTDDEDYIRNSMF